MKKIFRRRGQATVEFVLLLPFFAMVLFSIIYIGMFVLDYVTLDHATFEYARTVARTNDQDILDEAWSKAKTTKIFFDKWYTVGDSLTSTVDGDYVTATMTVTLNGDKSDTLFGSILPKAYTVSKTVRVES